MFRLGRDRPIQDFVDLTVISFDAASGNVMSKKVDFCGKKDTLLEGAEEVRIAQGFKDLSDVHLMFLNRIRPNDHIVEVNMADLADEVAEARVTRR